MIESLTLKNFTVFHDLSVEFSPGINVFIGESSTGKTHLLKAAYGLCAGTKQLIPSDFVDAFIKLFLPIDGNVAALHTYGASGKTQFDMMFASKGRVELSFDENGTGNISFQGGMRQLYPLHPVFIPAKEVLSFMRGFNSLYEKYSIDFDRTYQDVYLLLELPELRPEKLPKESKWAMQEIETLCGGRFIFEGGGKVTFETNGTKYSANSMAEGFRKIGMLSRLLETGAIQPGTSGTLFWDEPESNLNPKMMELLVQILLELSRHGQQIILATHDYVLLKWFDLLMDKEKGDRVCFHSLYRDPEDAKIKINSTSEYLEITPNPIDDAFDDLIGQQIENDMGGLGK